MGKPNARVLVVDDEEAVRKLLQARFAREGWSVETAEDGTAGARLAVEAARSGASYHAVVTDIKMPGLDGFQLIEKLRAERCEGPVLVITGQGGKERAIEAIHSGVFDYLEKPLDLDALTEAVRRALEHEFARLRQQSELEVKTELLERVAHAASRAEEEPLIGKSSHIQNIKEMAAAVAANHSGANGSVVLISGEGGVGKEVVARYVHKTVFGAEGRRRPFVAIHCAAFPGHLLESELFGHEKGVFAGAPRSTPTRKLGLFELAGSGTLFLDEIGEMDIGTQAKLLRVLHGRAVRRMGGAEEIDVSALIIAATSRDLSRAVSDGRFREDLFYRLNTLPLTVPPLRSRAEDIPALAEFFLRQWSKPRGKEFTGFSPAASRAMEQYRWPGNVRELRGVIERAVILEKGPQLELSQFRQESLRAAAAAGGAAEQSRVVAFGRGESQAGPAGAAGGNGAGAPPRLAPTGPLLYSAVEKKGLALVRKEVDEDLTRDVLLHLLASTQGNVSAVSRGSKLDRANLLRLLRRFEIDPDLFRLQKKAS